MARLGLKVAATNGVRTLKARTPARTVPVLVPMRDEDQQKDHFITRNGLTYAGSHLIIDLWDAERLGDRDHIEQALIDAVKAAGATLLHIHLHTFTEGECCGAQRSLKFRLANHRCYPSTLSRRIHSITYCGQLRNSIF